MDEEWLEWQVEKRLEGAHLQALDDYIGRGGSDPEQAEEAVVRERLRQHLRAQLKQSLPDEFKELFSIMERSRTADFPADERLSPEEHRNFIQKWNDAWFRNYTYYKSLPPSMARYSFQFRDLHGISLSNANLQSNSEDYDADHQGVNLAEAQLDGANLARANLTHAILERANLREAYLPGTTLVNANLRGADLSGANLRGADLTNADLSGATLRHTDLEGAKLLHATLDYADLRSVRGILFDENSIFRAKFTNRSGLIWQAFIGVYAALRWLNRKLPFGIKEGSGSLFVEDSWSVLRRSYTGPNFFISLLFLIAFIVPYLAQALILARISQAEHGVLSILAPITGWEPEKGGATLETLQNPQMELPQRYDRLHAVFEDATRATQDAQRVIESLAGSVAPDALRAIQEAINRVIPSLTALGEQVAAFRADMGRRMASKLSERQYRVGHMLLGIDTGQWSWTLLLVLLFIYNGLKWFLTTTVAPMRDAEERSYVTPAKLEYLYLGRVCKL